MKAIPEPYLSFSWMTEPTTIPLVCAGVLSFSVFLFIFTSICMKRRSYKRHGFLRTEKAELQGFIADIQENPWQITTETSQRTSLDQRHLVSLLTEADQPHTINRSPTKTSKTHEDNNSISSSLRHDDHNQINNNNNAANNNSSRRSKYLLNQQQQQQQQVQSHLQQQQQSHQHLSRTSPTKKLGSFSTFSKRQTPKKKATPLYFEEQHEQLQPQPFDANQELHVQIDEASYKNSNFVSFSSMNKTSPFLLSQVDQLLQNAPSESTRNSSRVTTVGFIQPTSVTQLPGQSEATKESPSIFDSVEAHETQLQKIALDTQYQQQRQQQQGQQQQLQQHQQEIQIGSSSTQEEDDHEHLDILEDIYDEEPPSVLVTLKQLFYRHNIILNTLGEDSIMFPRIFKLMLISWLINMVGIACSVAEVYTHNVEVDRITAKYARHSLETVQSKNVYLDTEAQLLEYTIVLGIASGCFVVSAITSMLIKASREILYINMTNGQLIRNLMEIREKQADKMVIGFFASFCFAAYAFAHHAAYLSRFDGEATQRWTLMFIGVIGIIFLGFDAVYFTVIAILKSIKEESQLAERVYTFMIGKLAWWSI